MSFGKRLRQLRLDKEITQLQLSGILDTAKSNISKYEADTIEPNISMLRKLGEYFNVSVDYLLGITDMSSPYGSDNEHIWANEEVGESLAYWIKKTGLSYAEVAETVGISENRLEDYCSGYMEPTLEVLEGLAKLCSVSTDCLLGFREKSRPVEPDGNMPFPFDPEISRRLKEQAQQMNQSYSTISNVIGIEEEEVFNLFEYGFLPHINALIRLAKLFHVSADYLVHLSDSKKTLDITIESEYNALRQLNPVNRSIIYGEILKLIKEQEREKYLDSQSVAADRVAEDPGIYNPTTKQGKLYPSNGTEG